MAVSVVFFSFSRAAQTEARGPLCWLSLLRLIQQLLWTPTYQGLQEPLRPGLAFPTTSRLYNSNCNCLTSVLTELYNSSTSAQSPTRSLEWLVWSSSRGNNCHAVNRSLSSGASVYECTMGILACPILLANFSQRDFLSYLPLACVTSFRCITLEWHFWPGRRSKYNNFCSGCPDVVSIVSSGCNQSSPALFYLIFESLYR